MAEEARMETVRIIKHATKPRDNLNKTERIALRSHKNNTDLTILPADKGNATLILNTTDYQQKIASLLSTSIIQKINQGPHRFNRTENYYVN